MITFNTSTEFYQFVAYAVEQGLAYTAVENGGVYTVKVTGY